MELRGSKERPIFLPSFKEWFDELPKCITFGMDLDEIYKVNKGYYDYLKHAYDSGKGITITKVIK